MGFRVWGLKRLRALQSAECSERLSGLIGSRDTREGLISAQVLNASGPENPAILRDMFVGEGSCIAVESAKTRGFAATRVESD